ncbi:hypothetical protein b3_0128 [Synechococcus phage B3]|nr:hypothetical protein b3_0128 [Synechococcus phage B3]QGT54742.1 hypothetical protein b23_0127 [Synechococcus phage B23]
MNQNKGWWKKNFKTKEDMISAIDSYLLRDMSLTEIAKNLGTSAATIHAIMKRNNIHGRRKELRSKDWLYQKYIIEKLSMNELSKILNVSYQSISYYLNKHNIQKRSIQEIQKLASVRYRSNSQEYFPDTNIKTRGYSIWCNGLWFASGAEFLYYLILEKNNINYVFQKSLEGRRPDYIVNDKMVVEIKSGQLSDDQIESHSRLSSILKNKYNYTYKIIYVDQKYKSLYYRVNKKLKSLGAKRGVGIAVEYDEFLKLVS